MTGGTCMGDWLCPTVKTADLRLEFETVDDELHGKRVAVLGDKWHWSPRIIKRLFKSLGVIVVWLRSVGRWEESRRDTILFHESLRHDKEELCPNFSNRVHIPVTRLSRVSN